MISGEFGFELLEHGAHDICPALQNRLNVLIYFRLDIMVLPDVTVEFNFHGAGSYSTSARKQELFITGRQRVSIPFSEPLAAGLARGL